MVDTYGLPTTLPHQLGFPPPPNFNLPSPSTSAAPDPPSSSSASTLPPPSLNKARIPAFASSRPSIEAGGRVPDLQGWTGQGGGGAGGAPSYQPHSGSSAQAGVSSFAPQVAAFSAGANGAGGALTGPPTANKNIPAFGAAPPSTTAATSLPPIQGGVPAPAPASDASAASDAPKAKKPRRKSRLLDILAEPSGDNNDEDAALPSFAAEPPSRSPSPSPPPQAPARTAASSSSTSFGGGFQTASQRSPFLPLHPPAKSTTTAAAHTDAAQMLCHLAAQPSHSHSPSPSSSSAPAPIPSLIPQGNPFAAQYAPSQLPQPPPSVLQQQQQQLASPPESNGSGSGSGDAQEGANKGGKELKQTKRAAQNRAAQRAFRERKQQQIRDLEELASRLPNLERDLLFARQLIAQLQAEKMAWEREREALRGEVGALRGMIGVGAAGQGGVVGQVQGGGGEKRPREDGGAVVEGGMAEGEAAKRAREGEL